LPYLEAGEYTVEVSPPAGWEVVPPSTAAQAVALAAGETREGVDFGLLPGPGTSFWQNPRNVADVDDTGAVTVDDMQLLVDDLLTHGIRELPAPSIPSGATWAYVDPTGDGRISLRDAAIVYGELLTGQGGGAKQGSASADNPAGGGKSVPGADAEGAAVAEFDGAGTVTVEMKDQPWDEPSWSSRSNALLFGTGGAVPETDGTLKRELQQAQWGAPLSRLSLSESTCLPGAKGDDVPQPVFPRSREPGGESQVAPDEEWVFDDIAGTLAEDVARAWKGWRGAMM
jgi:hypothetical protein